MDGRALNIQSFESMMKTFDGRHHRPSEAMQEGLRSLQDTLTKMVLGKAESSYYLSSLDPGVGKSTAIIKWIDTYLQCREIYGKHGIIICFDRLDEINRFVDECKIPYDTFAVKVSNSDQLGRDLNNMGLGTESVNDALVLFTTKQQIMLKCKGKGFKGTAAFHYQGGPRRVRIWDESLIVGRELTLDRFELLGLTQEVSKTNPSIALKIEDIASQLKGCNNGEVFHMPDMGMTLNDIMCSLPWASKEKRDVAEILGMFLGRAITVRTDHRGHVAVDCGEAIPEDFAPCLVTDASGRVRETYNLQHHYRGDLIRLRPDAAKEYSNLTISVWRKGSGKSAYEKNGHKVYAEEIVKVIDSRPNEEFLVVRHLEHDDLETDIKKQVSVPDRVKFIHWGRHTATNDFSHIPNIIISSPLNYRLADYEATGRASATLKTTDGALTNEQLNQMRLGENAHHLLQAVCRGLVRRSEGAGCPPAKVWLIASPSTKIESNLPTVFPHCKMELWNTSPDALKGVRLRAFELIKNKFVDSNVHCKVLVPAHKVRKLLGLPQSNFKRDILKNNNFNDILGLHNIFIERISNRYYFVSDNFDYGAQVSL
ncbi:hypothetical protein A2G06_09920 [Geobacter anodireducens]|nr:hypothetical protein A2G06_09920 [Geobacter anodireducens]